MCLCLSNCVPIVSVYVVPMPFLIIYVRFLLAPGTIPVNSRGEKQRVHLRDSFLADEVDPIYVAYNL